MVSLIKYELKKHFLKRSIFMALLLFSVINLAKVDSIHREKSLLGDNTPSSWKSIYWQLYNDFSGPMTMESIEELMEIQRPLESQTADLTASTAMDNPDTYTGNVYSDYYLLTWCFVQPMEYLYMYQYNASEIVRIAQSNMRFYSMHESEYLYRVNEAIAKLFMGRAIRDFSYTEMYQYYLEYNFSSLFVILICLYGLVDVFVSEKEADMYVLLLTTASGGKKTVLAKVISSIFFIFAASVWFWVLDFIAFSFSFGSFEASSSPVFSLQNFEHAPVDLTLGQFAVFLAGIKCVGMMVIGMAILLISSKSKNVFLPFVTNLVLIGGSILAQEVVAGSEQTVNKILNPFILVANNELFSKVEFVNFFGIPVLSYIAATIFAVISGVILIALIILSARKNTMAARR